MISARFKKLTIVAVALGGAISAFGALAQSAAISTEATKAAVVEMSPPLTSWSAPQYLNPPRGIYTSPSMAVSGSGGKSPTKDELFMSTFIPVTPCRLVDTRGVFSPVYAGGPFAANEVRNYAIPGHCGVPTGANRMDAVSIAITTPPTGSGDIEVIATGATLGSTVAMVIQAGQWNSVSSTPAVDGNGSIQVQLRSTPGNVVIDVNGYYASVSNSNTSDYFGVEGIYASDGGLFFVENKSSVGAAINAANISGADVHLAQGANAIDVSEGGFRVRGASTVGGDTFVTRHQVNTAGTFVAGTGTLCGTAAGFNNASVIDNAIANGNPNALLFITPTLAVGGTTSPANAIYQALYNGNCGGGAAANKWSIYNLTGTAMPNGLLFNVMIIVP